MGLEKAERVEPRYAAVARVLKEEIIDGIHPVGTLLPTENQLCRRFGVSRHTVRDALRLLREERLVSSRQGAGTQVAAPSDGETFRLEASSINDLAAYAADLYTEIRTTRMEVLDGRSATRFGLIGGQEWFVVRGLARFRKRPTPVCWSEYCINPAFAGVGRFLPRDSGPIFLLIEETYGVTMAEMDQTISVATLPRPIAVELGAEPGETSVEVRRTYRTTDGRLAQVSIHSHRASRFQQTIKMKRLKS